MTENEEDYRGQDKIPLISRRVDAPKASAAARIISGVQKTRDDPPRHNAV